MSENVYEEYPHLIRLYKSNPIYEASFLRRITYSSKTCVQWPLTNRQNKDHNDK